MLDLYPTGFRVAIRREDRAAKFGRFVEAVVASLLENPLSEWVSRIEAQHRTRGGNLDQAITVQ
jgi:hypothetical protein